MLLRLKTVEERYEEFVLFVTGVVIKEEIEGEEEEEREEDEE